MEKKAELYAQQQELCTFQPNLHRSQVKPKTHPSYKSYTRLPKYEELDNDLQDQASERLGSFGRKGQYMRSFVTKEGDLAFDKLMVVNEEARVSL